MVHGPTLAEALLAESTGAAPAIRYVSPAGARLRRYTADTRGGARRPDAGGRELAAFPGPTRWQLIVGMYDFGARHIVAALQAIGQRARYAKLTLVMQKGASIGRGTKADDLDDAAVVVEALGETLAERFTHAWVRIGSVNGWVASSYHIKGAVRVDQAAWLSSGNWQSSNQPPADPLAEQPPDRQWSACTDREWHIVIEHAGLARTLAAHPRNDCEHNLDKRCVGSRRRGRRGRSCWWRRLGR